MKRFGLAVSLILAGTIFAWAGWSDRAANRDWKTVERLMGYPGQEEGDGFKISVPRSDLNVLVQGSWVDPRAGLDSWFAFNPLSKGSLLIGEVVLVDWEVPRAEALLASNQLVLTSLYRPFNGETPGIERLGFMGKGSRVLLAQEARTILAATSMTLVSISPAATPSAAPNAFCLPLEKILGPARWDGGVLSFSFFPKKPVMNEGIEIPAYMGFETVFHFQPDGKQAEVYGQWVLSQEEGAKVVESLMKNHIGITGTHSSILNLSPVCVFIDFWAEGNPVKIAKNLQEALGLTQLAGWTPNTPKKAD